MTVFRPPVYDADYNEVKHSDVGPIDPAREHDVATCEVDGCWACAFHARHYGCVGCGDVVAEGHRCEKCRRVAS